MVLAAVGKNGTGKDFFLEYVAKTYGFPMISIGDVVRELAAADGLELTRDNLHATSKQTARPSSPSLSSRRSRSPTAPISLFRASVRLRISRYSRRLSATSSCLLTL